MKRRCVGRKALELIGARAGAGLWFVVIMLSSCMSVSVPAPDPESQLIAKGREIFFNEASTATGGGAAPATRPRTT